MQTVAYVFGSGLSEDYQYHWAKGGLRRLRRLRRLLREFDRERRW